MEGKAGPPPGAKIIDLVEVVEKGTGPAADQTQGGEDLDALLAELGGEAPAAEAEAAPQ